MSEQSDRPGSSREIAESELGPVLISGGELGDESPVGGPVLTEDWGRLTDSEGLHGTLEEATGPVEPASGTDAPVSGDVDTSAVTGSSDAGDEP
ncbi:MAG: hypothetical protein ACK47B_24995 [Armatimonadota bacterium]